LWLDESYLVVYQTISRTLHMTRISLAIKS
jgi:hypothetical protein